MTAISDANVLAMAEISRLEAVETIQRLAKKAKQGSDPQAAFDNALNVMREAWAARSLGMMSAMSPTFNWRTMDGRDLLDPETFRKIGVLLIAGHPELIERIEAVIREYNQPPADTTAG